MTYLRWSTKYYVLFFFIVLSIPFLAPQAAHAATFDPSRIIDDGIFYNSKTMTVAQIQAFLDSKMPNCDTNGVQQAHGTTRAVYSRSKGFPPPFVCLNKYYENSSTHTTNLTKIDGQSAPIPVGGQSAAQIIATAAEYYGINPQVLLVTLQKESGLITDDWPWPSQYNTSMGYGCPDSGPNYSANCSSQYFGFYNQINWAAKQFRIYATSPNSFNFVPGPGNSVRFNPQPSCGSTILNIQNQATASLYDYTPYQPNASALAAGYGTGDACGAYGNRNFWLYFNDWFGSTQFPQPTGGSLLYQGSTGKFYLVTAGVRYYIPSWSILANYGLDTYPVQPVVDAAIQQYTDGGDLTNLIWDSNGVYLVNNRTRYHVTSSMCSAWGFNCTDSTVVKPLGSVFQTQYLVGGPELPNLASSDGTIYKMMNGSRLPIANPKSFSDLGFSAQPVLVTSMANSNQPLGPLLVTTPGVIQFLPNLTIYYYDGSSYYSVGDMNIYQDWKIGSSPQLSGSVSSYNTTPPDSTPLPSYYQDATGNKFIIDQGRKIRISSSLQTAWSGLIFSTSAPTALMNSLVQTTLQTNIWTNPDFYVIDTAKKHYVATNQDYAALGLNPSNTTGLRSDKLSQVPRGDDALGEGKTVSVADGSSKLYVVNNHRILQIYAPNTFNAYGYSGIAVTSYATGSINDYPVDASILVSSKTPDGNLQIVSGNTLYQLSPTLAADFGAINTKFTSINQQIIKSNPSQISSRFFRNPSDGSIYYASGGAIHHVTSYASFMAYGGGRAQILQIDSETLTHFIEAQPI